MKRFIFSTIIILLFAGASWGEDATLDLTSPGIDWRSQVLQGNVSTGASIREGDYGVVARWYTPWLCSSSAFVESGYGLHAALRRMGVDSSSSIDRNYDVRIVPVPGTYKVRLLDMFLDNKKKHSFSYPPVKYMLGPEEADDFTSIARLQVVFEFENHSNIPTGAFFWTQAVEHLTLDQYTLPKRIFPDQCVTLKGLDRDMYIHMDCTNNKKAANISRANIPNLQHPFNVYGWDWDWDSDEDNPHAVARHTAWSPYNATYIAKPNWSVIPIWNDKDRLGRSIWMLDAPAISAAAVTGHGVPLLPPFDNALSGEHERRKELAKAFITYVFYYVNDDGTISIDPVTGEGQPTTHIRISTVGIKWGFELATLSQGWKFDPHGYSGDNRWFIKRNNSVYNPSAATLLASALGIGQSSTNGTYSIAANVEDPKLVNYDDVSVDVANGLVARHYGQHYYEDDPYSPNATHGTLPYIVTGVDAYPVYRVGKNDPVASVVTSGVRDDTTITPWPVAKQYKFPTGATLNYYFPGAPDHPHSQYAGSMVAMDGTCKTDFWDPAYAHWLVLNKMTNKFDNDARQYNVSRAPYVPAFDGGRNFVGQPILDGLMWIAKASPYSKIPMEPNGPFVWVTGGEFPIPASGNGDQLRVSPLYDQNKNPQISGSSTDQIPNFSPALLLASGPQLPIDTWTSRTLEPKFFIAADLDGTRWERTVFMCWIINPDGELTNDWTVLRQPGSQLCVASAGVRFAYTLKYTFGGGPIKTKTTLNCPTTMVTGDKFQKAVVKVRTVVGDPPNQIITGSPPFGGGRKLYLWLTNVDGNQPTKEKWGYYDLSDSYSFGLEDLPVGQYTVVGVYKGGFKEDKPPYMASTSDPVTLIVKPDNFQTTTTIVSFPNSPIKPYDSTASCTVQVSSQDLSVNNPPAGKTVDLYITGLKGPYQQSPYKRQLDSQGKATFGLSLPADTYTIYADFPEQTPWQGSTSDAKTVFVNNGKPIDTIITMDPLPGIIWGDNTKVGSVSVKAKDNTVPPGTVEIWTDDFNGQAKKIVVLQVTSSGIITPLFSGQDVYNATRPYPFSGIHIVAGYFYPSDSARYWNSNSTPQKVDIESSPSPGNLGITTHTTISQIPSVMVSGQNPTAIVTVRADNNVVPAGNVLMHFDGTNGAANFPGSPFQHMLINGSTTYTMGALANSPPGTTYNVWAEYKGNIVLNLNPSDSFTSAQQITINPSVSGTPTTTKISAPPITDGTDAKVVVTVIASGAASASSPKSKNLFKPNPVSTPTGTVTLSVDGDILSPVSLDLLGNAVFTLHPSGGPGDYHLFATYNPTGTFQSSQGQATLIVLPQSSLTPTKLTADCPNQINSGDPDSRLTVTVMAELLVQNASVAFNVSKSSPGGTPAVGKVRVNYQGPWGDTNSWFYHDLINGSYKYTLGSLPPGTYQVTATFDQQNGYAASSYKFLLYVR